ncbi:hypothetical protein EJ04DRAFT_597248 [Polyplosphaeria fusca]|uniref:Uncharacterized protein n=1 Tax=Polyplosphaeria fusca TaxID=682080 RepID=A0A9P4R4S6_9PLEO|nr:hypothetical protein EJ04DRAFT_597248 [Polyplosphaeria fusca]
MRLSRAETLPQAVMISLLFTCRRIASEMRGVALRTNRITFTTGFSAPEPISKSKASRAGRFWVLWECARIIKMEMLQHAAVCVSADVVNRLHKLYPLVSIYFDPPLKDSTSLPGWLLGFFNGYHSPLLLPWSELWGEAHHAALNLARNQDRPKFDALAIKALSLCDAGLMEGPCFDEQAMDMLMDWQPLPWSIPVEDQLAPSEQHFTEPRTDFECWDPNGVQESTQTKWFFSAAAVAIDFLSNLPLEERRNVQDITLLED